MMLKTAFIKLSLHQSSDKKKGVRYKNLFGLAVPTEDFTFTFSQECCPVILFLPFPQNQWYYPPSTSRRKLRGGWDSLNGWTSLYFGIEQSGLLGSTVVKYSPNVAGSNPRGGSNRRVHGKFQLTLKQILSVFRGFGLLSKICKFSIIEPSKNYL